MPSCRPMSPGTSPPLAPVRRRGRARCDPAARSQLDRAPVAAMLALEIGETQGAAVTEPDATRPDFARSTVRPDLAGRDRVVVARRGDGESA